MAKKPTDKNALSIVPLDLTKFSKLVDKDLESTLGNLYLRKGLGAVQIQVVSGKRSLLQRKAINALLKVVADQGFDKQSYLTTRIEFSKSSGFNSNDIDYLKATAEAITDMRVVFDVMNEENVRHVGSVNMFSAIVFRSDGKIYIEMPELTKRMLGDDKKFALINMQIHGDFNSLHGYILYENTTLYADEGTTPKFSLAELKKLLEIDEEQPTYQEFKFFNNKVIKPGTKEVNSISDIVIEPIYHRTGRVITHISFNVERKPQAMFDFLIKNESLGLEQKIVDFGVTEKVARQLVMDYDPERILGNIDYTVKKFETGKVDEDGLAGYLIKAIKEDYRPKESPLVKKAREQRAADQKKKEEASKIKEAEETKKKTETTEKNNKAKEYFENLSEDEKTDLLEYYKEYLAKNNTVVLGQFKKSGLKMASVQSQLWYYIKENRLNQ